MACTDAPCETYPLSTTIAERTITPPRLPVRIDPQRDLGRQLVGHERGRARATSLTVGRRSVAVLDELPGVTWIRSYLSHTDGKISCEYDASDAESIREPARRAGLPVDRIAEITLGVSPAMFR